MSEEYLLDKEETVLPGAGTKWLNSMAIQMEYGNKNEAGKGGRRQDQNVKDLACPHAYRIVTSFSW